MNQPYIPRYFIHIAIGFALGIICTLLYTCTNDTVISTPPAKEIVQEAEKKVSVIDTSISQLKVEYRKTKDTITDLNKKLYAAWQENKRLKVKWSNSTTLNLGNSTELNASKSVKSGALNFESSFEITNGTASDYITDLQNAAAIADSLCAETVNKYETALLKSDSISSHEKAKGEIYRAGMNSLAINSNLKDQQIKSLSKKLKWQKVIAILVVGALLIKK